VRAHVSILGKQAGVSFLGGGKENSNHSSLLDRETSSPDSPTLTHTQAQVDQLVTGFAKQATDWRSLTAMTVGGMAYRASRIGILASGGTAGTLTTSLFQGASLLGGLGTEVTAFEMTNRSLSQLTGESSQNPNLWKWNGHGGIKQGWLSSFVTFGTLKGFGKLSEGQNLILQHGAQDMGMVLGHQLLYKTGLGEKPEGTLAEQLLNAEITNLQIGAGMALGHSLSGGRVRAVERALDLSASGKPPRLQETRDSPFFDSLLAMAMAGNGKEGSSSPSQVLMAEKKSESTESSKGGKKRSQIVGLKKDQGIDWSAGLVPDMAKLEQVLQEILELQFRNDTHAMSAGAINLTKYVDSKGDSISGRLILYRYCHARWLADHPGEKDISQDKAIHVQGYKPSDSVEHFKRKLGTLSGDYQLQDSGHDYNWSVKAAVDIGKLESILKEVYKIQFQENPNDMLSTPIERSSYLDPNGRLIQGNTILRHYARARWLADHPGEKDVGLAKVYTLDGYRPPDCIDHFKRKILGFVPELKWDYQLKASGHDYDWSKNKKPDLKKLEEIFKEILEVQFQGDPESMNMGKIETMNYLDPNGNVLLGNTLMRHYSHARWLADHPEKEDIRQQRVINLNGYRCGNSIEYFIRNVVKHTRANPANFELKISGWNYDSYNDDGTHLSELENILKEILEIQFNGDPAKMNAAAIEENIYLAPDGKNISGRSLLTAYSFARWHKDRPEEAELKKHEVRRYEGYKHRQSVEYFKKEILGYSPEIKADVQLQTSGLDYDWSFRTMPRLEKLEEILKEILKLQFEGNSKTMIARAISETTYLDPKGHPFTGQTLLKGYSYARWRKDHPENAGLNQHKALKVEGYKVTDSLDYFKQKVMGFSPEIKWDFQLNSSCLDLEDPKKEPDLAGIEKVLTEILDLQFKGNTEQMTVSAIGQTTYRDAQGSIMKGKTLLNSYSHARWLSDTRGKEGFDPRKIMTTFGYRKSDSIDHFLRNVLSRLPSISPDFQLNRSGGGYDWSKGAEPQLDQLEAMLREILELQFSDQPGKMTASTINETSYLTPDGIPVKGDNILKHYSHARWLKDHPETQGKARGNILSLSGYLPSESLNHFLREVVGFRPQAECDFHLSESGRGYDWSSGAKPDVEILEGMLRNILKIQFNDQPDEMIATTISKTSYLDAERRPVKGPTLLRHYSYARWFRDHPGEELKRKDKILRVPGYRLYDSLNDFLKKETGFHPTPRPDVKLERPADGYRLPRGSHPNLKLLEELLKEILKNQFMGKPEDMKSVAIGKKTYSLPDGTWIKGASLLNHYSYARWLKDHPDETDIGFSKAVRLPGYSAQNSVDHFLKKVIGFIPEIHANYHLVNSGKGYDWSKGAKPDLTLLEDMLKEVLKIQFEGQPERVVASSIGNTLYLDPEGVPIQGATLLNHYSHSRWLKDHPEEKDIGQQQVKRLPNYRGSDSVNYFLRDVLGFVPKVQADFHLRNSGQDYDESVKAKPSLELLGNMLNEILEIQFQNDPKKMTAGAIEKTTYVNGRGVMIQGQTFLNRYSHARWLKDHPEKSDLRQLEAIQNPGYLRRDSVNYFLNKAVGVYDFHQTSRADFDAFIQKASLSSILDLFPEDPALLIEALSFLKKEEFKNKDITDFVKAYLGLQVEKGRGEGKLQKIEADPWEKRRKYLLAVLQALESGADLDLSEVNFKRQVQLLIRLSRKAFEENSKSLIEELERLSERATHPFIQRLQKEVLRYFKETFDFEVTGMVTPPYGYQKEGAHFLATHDKAILADEAGMGKSYQVIAAAQSLGLKRVLWVTTASNKETLKEEILSHSGTNEKDVKIVISGDPKGRKEQIQSLNGERYVLTNYETLVALQKTDPDGYGKLTQGLDLIVVDEAQLTDNPETLRTKAIHDIASPRRWLLTATPYQNKPENIWTLLNWLDPEKYPDFAAFKQMYTKNTEGLILLHSELDQFMLRRTKKDTLFFFLPASEIPFDQQLADGVPRLPQRTRIPPEKSGSYFLSSEQADLIAWMTADFKGWVEHFNAHLPNGAEPIEVERINPLLKFDLIQKVIYEPKHFGIQGENPIFASLDQMLANRLAKGEKVILWGWNTSMIEALEKRYRSLGLRRIDGSVVGQAREDARHAFQENPNTRILVANYLSGGVGLTLTGAHSAIFVQIPPTYPLLYQAEGRHQRLIGLNNVRHAKEWVEVEWMLPRLPKGFVEEIKDPKLKEILSHGTLVEQTRSRLEGGEILYNLLLEGYGNLIELDKHFRAGILESLGLNRKEKLDYVSHLKGEVRAYAEVAQSLLPLWKLVKGNSAAEENTLRLLENFKDYPALAQKIGESFQKASKAYPEDLEFISSLFNIRNKYIREQMLKRVPDLLVKIYAQGKSLKESTEGLKIRKLSPTAFLAQIYTTSEIGGESIVQITQKLSSQRDTPAKRYLEEHFFSGVFGVMGNPSAETFLREKEVLLNNAPLIEGIHMIYRLGLLARTRVDLVGELRSASFDTWEGLSKALERATNQAIAEFAGRSAEQVEEMVQNNPNWHGNADPLLALMAGWRDHDEGVLLDQFQESLGHLLDGNYSEWRDGSNNKHYGNEIDYLEDSPQFWKEFARTSPTSLPQVKISSQKVNASFMRDYLALIQEARQEGEAVEGKWVHEQLQAYRDSDGVKKETLLRSYQEEVRVLGRLFGANEVTEETRSVLEKYGLEWTDQLSQKAALQEKLTELRNLLSWMNLDQSFRRIHQSQDLDKAALIRELDSKVKFYRGRKYDKMADHFETLKESMERWQQGEITFKDVAIEDSDDPAILTRMGALHPEMTNCFNPNGNPTFNQFVIAALGSKNMRMVIVREQGKIVAAAMMKVKQLEDGTPVLFLERGLYRKGYDFRQEMLDHLVKKASSMNPKPIVMDEARGKGKETDPIVLGTGAFTESEYVESVFGIRRAKSVKHRGRIYDPEKGGAPEVIAKQADPSQGELFPSPVIGIGTSTKTIQAYVKELKDQGVKLVVDVRGSPFSRYYPHFNKERLAAALQAQGIEYVWLGDVLGNPKDDKGTRSLEGFKNYMKSDSYKHGLARLMEIMEKAQGKVALTCAEGAEEACHRKFILEDLKRHPK
jgi:SNF2 domain-containing protein/uncharacterized protein DUF488/helicase-like protein